MEDKDYIRDLERLLVFMCESYVENKKIFHDDAIKNGHSDLYMNFPLIQGTMNMISIERISELTNERPTASIAEILEEMKTRMSVEKPMS